MMLTGESRIITSIVLESYASKHRCINPLNAELNPICHLLALLGAHHILHVSGIRVKRKEGGLWDRNCT